jgi:hypothetical protein
MTATEPVTAIPASRTAPARSEGGAPKVIIEAQAPGMPVISTTHCDIPNVTVLRGLEDTYFSLLTSR